MEIDEANLNRECLEYARLRVRSVVSFKIDIHEDIKINNIMCQVSVIKETSMDANDVYRRWWTKGEPRDSGSSINTIVGDTIQGDEEDWQLAEEPLAIESDKALNQYSKGALGFNGSHGARQEMKNMYFGDEGIYSSVNVEIGMAETDSGRNSSSEPGKHTDVFGKR